MKFNTLILLLLIFQTIIFSQSGWVQQNSGTNKRINSCYFLNDLTGYAVGEQGIILKTVNGGTNWNSVYNEYSYDAVDISFFNITTGWVYVTQGLVVDSTFILKTENGGLSWSKYFIDTIFGASWYCELQFLNNNTGYLASYNNLKKTTNGGVNWFVIFNQSASGVFFVDNLTGWTSGHGPGVYKTTNGGVNWEYQQGAQIQNQNGADFYFFNSQSGFCIPKGFGYSGPLYSTSNGGNNWYRYLELPDTYWSIRFLNPNTGYMLAFSYFTFRDYISKTINGGINWISHNINSSQQLNKTFFSSVNTGWVVGDSGTILKTTSGGVTIGIQQISSEIPVNFSLSQNYPNPFNPSTKIKIYIPNAENSRELPVNLIVYDLLGREIEVLVNESLNPGIYEVDFDASHLPSGIYYYKLAYFDFTQTKKMVLLK